MRHVSRNSPARPSLPLRKPCGGNKQGFLNGAGSLVRRPWKYFQQDDNSTFKKPVEVLSASPDSTFRKPEKVLAD